MDFQTTSNRTLPSSPSRECSSNIWRLRPSCPVAAPAIARETTRESGRPSVRFEPMGSLLPSQAAGHRTGESERICCVAANMSHRCLQVKWEASRAAPQAGIRECAREHRGSRRSGWISPCSRAARELRGRSKGGMRAAWIAQWKSSSRWWRAPITSTNSGERMSKRRMSPVVPNGMMGSRSVDRAPTLR